MFIANDASVEIVTVVVIAEQGSSIWLKRW